MSDSENVPDIFNRSNSRLGIRRLHDSQHGSFERFKLPLTPERVCLSRVCFVPQEAVVVGGGTEKSGDLRIAWQVHLRQKLAGFLRVGRTPTTSHQTYDWNYGQPSCKKSPRKANSRVFRHSASSS
jgi:hypothetical protein